MLDAQNTLRDLCTVKPLAIASEGTAKNKRMQENNSCEKVIYMGDVQRLEKVNDTYVQTVHAGTMGRGFTALKTAPV
jgi:hypothetical protein